MNLSLFRRRLVALVAALPFLPKRAVKEQEITVSPGPWVALTASAEDTWELMQRVAAREKAKAERTGDAPDA